MIWATRKGGDACGKRSQEAQKEDAETQAQETDGPIPSQTEEAVAFSAP